MQYQVLVFLHVVGALGVFAALGIEAVALRGLRRAPAPDAAREWLGLFTLAARIGLVSMVLLLGAGIALMITVWHRQPWISAAFVGIVIMAVLGGAVTSRKLRALRAWGAGGSPPDRPSAALSAALVVRIAVAIGIIALMTAKPGPAGSAQILAAAVVFGAVASVPGLRRS